MKPFLKWVGGKTQILPQVLSKFPREINDYYEPFVGGGSVLLGLLTSDINIRGKVYASDNNPSLIYTYRNIQSDPDTIYEKTNEHIILLSSLPDVKGVTNPNREESLQSRESYYYWIRSEYNKLDDKSSIEASAMFIFLNKTCFRGLHRVGPNGFNVPWGHYKNTNMIPKQQICDISILIKNVTFDISDWSSSINRAITGDFVYLDPPYAPVDNTSFVGYTAQGFSEHIILFDSLKASTYKWVMSNSNVPLVTDSFHGYAIEVLECRRAINSKNPRQTAQEVLVLSR